MTSNDDLKITYSLFFEIRVSRKKEISKGCSFIGIHCLPSNNIYTRMSLVIFIRNWVGLIPITIAHLLIGLLQLNRENDTKNLPLVHEIWENKLLYKSHQI